MLEQPAIESLVRRMAEELDAKAALLLHENGQVLESSGWLAEHEYPAMAALVAAMIATGKSLSAMGESFGGAPNRFSCDSDALGLYLVSVGPEAKGLWLAALFDQPLNPGRLRMKVRRYAETMASLGASRPEEAQAMVTKNVASRPAARAVLPPMEARSTGLPENITQADSSLFSNITDDEIDRLFEEVRS